MTKKIKMSDVDAGLNKPVVRQPVLSESSEIESAGMVASIVLFSIAVVTCCVSRMR